MLTLIFGPMYAAKSKYLLKYATGKYEAYIPTIDTRSGATIQSRDGEYCVAKQIGENEDFVTNQETILVDEGQFLTEKQILELKEVSKKKSVYVAALDTDFKQEPFPMSRLLFSVADRVIHLTSKCEICGKENATMSRRKTKSNNLIEVGSDDYFPICPNCM